MTSAGQGESFGRDYESTAILRQFFWGSKGVDLSSDSLSRLKRTSDIANSKRAHGALLLDNFKRL